MAALTANAASNGFAAPALATGRPDRVSKGQPQPRPDQGRLPAGPARRSRAHLARAIEDEIVPRLLLARPAATADAPPSNLDVATLAGLLLRSDDSAKTFVAAQQSRGLPLEAVYLDLLAPAARQLGEAWDQDKLDFTQVTLGLFRLQGMLRDLAPVFRPEARRRDRRRRILLAPVPGEQHVFAAAMLAEFFRCEGWTVEAPIDATADDLARLVAREQFAMIGLSLSGEDRLDTVPALIRGLRRASRQPSLGVLVGGPAFVAHPDYVTLVGADATAVDARQAMKQAETLLGLLRVRPA